MKLYGWKVRTSAYLCMVIIIIIIITIIIIGSY
jgi:hypothetical protein